MKKRPVPAPAPHAVRIASFAALAVTAAAVAWFTFLPPPDPAGEADGRLLPAGTDPHAPSSPGPADPGVPSVSALSPGASRTVAPPTSSTDAVPVSDATMANPFIAVPVPTSLPVGPSGPTPAPSAGASVPTGRESAAEPRYRTEAEYFLSRLEALENVLRSSRFHTASYDVDAANPTCMVVLADSREQADNLDGYFRFAVDRDGETWGNAPLALGIGRLHTDSGRDRAYAEGTFCSDGLDRLLDDALQAVLGDAYEAGMTDFILERYRTARAAGVSSGGAERPTGRTVASFTWIDVVYVDAFASYVEFYPVLPSSKA